MYLHLSFVLVMCMDIDSKYSKAVVGSADNRIVQIAISAAPVSSLVFCFLSLHFSFHLQFLWFIKLRANYKYSTVEIIWITI